MSTVALTMALLTIRSFLFIIVFITFIFARTARSLIQYDRQALLDVCSSMGKDFFTPYQTLCGDSFVLPPPCLRRQRRRKKRGKLAGILCRSRTRYCNPPLPRIWLANVQSLENKMDELHARFNFQREIANCCVLAFTETWLDPTVPDSAVSPSGFSITIVTLTLRTAINPSPTLPLVRRITPPFFSSQPTDNG